MGSLEMEEEEKDEGRALTIAEGVGDGVGEGVGDRVVETTSGTTVQLVTTHKFVSQQPYL